MIKDYNGFDIWYDGLGKEKIRELTSNEWTMVITETCICDIDGLLQLVLAGDLFNEDTLKIEDDLIVFGTQPIVYMECFARDHEVY